MQHDHCLSESRLRFINSSRQSLLKDPYIYRVLQAFSEANLAFHQFLEPLSFLSYQQESYLAQQSSIYHSCLQVSIPFQDT